MPLFVPQSSGWNPGAPALASGGSTDDKLWLVVAVVAVAILPVVLYSFDAPAPRLVLQRFACPTFGFEYQGGVETSRSDLGNVSHAVNTGRLEFGYRHFAVDLRFDSSRGAVDSFATHVILRALPRSHVEGGLAVGYRRSVFRDLRQEGFELGLPHRYTFWREDLRSFGLELRPSLFFSAGRVEPSLEAAVLIPIFDVLHLRAGGRAFTFNGSVFWGLQAGLSLTL